MASLATLIARVNEPLHFCSCERRLCIRSARNSEHGGMKASASALENKLAKATSRARVLVVIGAFLSFLFSVSLWFWGMREEGVFVGLWVPSILSLGNLLLSPRS